LELELESDYSKNQIWNWVLGIHSSMCGIGIRTETRIFDKKRKKNQRANGQLTTSSDLCYLEPFSELEPKWKLELFFPPEPEPGLPISLCVELEPEPFQIMF
jgi:hypothetical protein